MKTKFLFFFIMAVIMTGCTSTSKSEMPPVQELSRVQAQPPLGIDEIKVIRVINYVQRGGQGSITIQGQPGVKYNITSTFRLGDKTLTAFQTETAGENGQVTWTWDVRPETAAGTYPITISGGGKTLVTSYTVMP